MIVYWTRNVKEWLYTMEMLKNNCILGMLKNDWILGMLKDDYTVCILMITKDS